LIEDEITQSLVTQFVSEFHNGAGNKGETKSHDSKFFWQGMVVSVDTVAGKCVVSIDGEQCEVRYVDGATITAGKSVWGFQQGRIKIALGKLRGI
jgi:hypothetical protein